VCAHGNIRRWNANKGEVLRKEDEYFKKPGSDIVKKTNLPQDKFVSQFF
jgi:hypothetical protein